MKDNHNMRGIGLIKKKLYCLQVYLLNMNYIKAHEKTMPSETMKVVTQLKHHLEEHKFIEIYGTILPAFDDILELPALYDLLNEIELQLIRYALHLFTLSHTSEHPVTFITNLLNNEKAKKTISKQTLDSLQSILNKDKAFDNILNHWNRAEVLGEQCEIEVVWDENMNKENLKFFRGDQTNKISEINARIGNLTLSSSNKALKDIESLRNNLEMQRNQKTTMHRQLTKFFKSFCLEYTGDSANFEGQINQLQQRLQNQLKSLNSSVEVLGKQKQDIQASLEQQIKQQALFQQTIRNLQNQNNATQQQLKKITQQLNTQIQRLKEELSLETNANEKISKQNKINTKKIDELSSKLRTVQNSHQIQLHQNQNFKVELHKTKQALQTSKQVNQSLTQELSSRQLILDQRSSELQKSTLANNQLSSNNQSLRNQLYQLQQTIADLQQHIQDLKSYHLTTEQNLLSERLFSHEILFDRPEDNIFLASTLKDRYNSSISSTKLLCKYDPINKINFHRYIDNIPCILLVAKVDNGTIVAGFSLSPLFSGCKSEDALIIAVSSRQVFYLKTGGRGVTYDEYFLIFGNSELRIKSGQLQIFSNLGVNNSYFDNRGLTVNTLFGHEGKEREVKIERYEIYQVLFKDKPYIATK